MATFLLLISCGEQEKEPATSAPEASGGHSLPSDWKPEDPRLTAGRAIYLAECALCHDEGEEGAPALSHAEQWKQRRKKEQATLIDHAINGFLGEDGEMPARGGTGSLSDEEVTQAVLYMLAATEHAHPATP